MNRLEAFILWSGLLLTLIGLLKTLQRVQASPKGTHTMVQPPRYWRRCQKQGHWYRTHQAQCPVDYSPLLHASSGTLSRIVSLSEHPLIALHFPDEQMKEAFVRFVLTYEEEHTVLLTPNVALDYWQQGQLWTLKRMA